MIEQVPSHTCHPALSHAVLPWTTERGAKRPAAQYRHRRYHIGTELRIPIKEQEALRLVALFPRLALPHRDPSCLQILGRVEVLDSTSVVGDHEEAIQNAKGHGWDCKEAHGADGFAMILQEGQPATGELGRSGRSSHPS